MSKVNQLFQDKIDALDLQFLGRQISDSDYKQSLRDLLDLGADDHYENISELRYLEEKDQQENGR
jgi:hypothetical protein